ncbi:MAG: hypothetical protein ABEH40_05445 [Haloferacaceae archaeon]
MAPDEQPGPEEKLEALRAHIEESDDIAEADAELLFEFDDRLAGTRVRRHEKLLRHCVILAEETEDGTLAASLTDREAAEEMMDWIFDARISEKANRNFRVALRVFGKKVSEGDDDELPDSIGWIPTHTSPDYDSSPGHVI